MNNQSKFDRIIEKIIQFRDQRDWKQFHDPKNLADAISIEVAELQEVFLWVTTEQSKDLPTEKIDRVKDELADIFIFSVYMCDHFGIDLLGAVDGKIDKNKCKYPLEKAKGSSKKYTEINYQFRSD